MTKLGKNLKASHHLNYNAKLDDMLGVVMGPNMFGERFTVIEQIYDPNTKKTRLGFVLTRQLELALENGN